MRHRAWEARVSKTSRGLRRLRRGNRSRRPREHCGSIRLKACGIAWRGPCPIITVISRKPFAPTGGLTDAPVVQVNLTTTFPGRIRAWGLHRFTVDRLFAATGSLCVVCYDGRRASPTFGCVNEFMLGERNQGLVLIPPGVYHGWRNIGADEATIVSMPSELYNHDGPDRWELPWDSDAAGRMIPYQWL
jgi:dTDP-4-dehydrorhamnose 3,5-epimerase